jgi:two-component system response regulator WspF
LSRLFGAEGGHQLVWTAADKTELMDRLAADRPDVLLLDLDLSPDTVHTTQCIMSNHSCAIIILASEPDKQTARVFGALAAGAIDAIPAPNVDLQGQVSRQAPLLACIRTIDQLQSPKNRRVEPASSSLLVMGASAGGPSALARVLSAFPADFSAAILIVQHLDPRFLPQMASWLQTCCSLPVATALGGDAPKRGTVLLARGPHHLILTPRRRLVYSSARCETASQVSVDVLFESAAAHWKGRLAGVLLTGMGEDGANGLKRLRDAHAFTIAQDQATSAVYGMPKTAADRGAAVAILPLDQIAPRLVAYFQKTNRME